MKKIFILIFVLCNSCNAVYKTNPILTTKLYSGYYYDLIVAAEKENTDNMKNIFLQRKINKVQGGISRGPYATTFQATFTHNKLIYRVDVEILRGINFRY